MKVRKSMILIIVLLLTNLFFIATTVLAILVIYVQYQSMPSELQEKISLPESAMIIGELNYGTFEEPYYFLKVRMNKEEFDIYREELGYALVPEDKNKYIYWQHIFLTGCDISEWWDPTDSLKETYYNPRLRFETGQGSIMKHENGILYFRSWRGY